MSKKNKKTKYLWSFVPVLIFLFFLYKGFSSSEALEDVQKIGNLGNQHIDTVESEHKEYNSNPPTSGPHIGGIARWGVSTEIIMDEMQVHNLEDGGVIIQYNPEKISEDARTQLENIVKQSSRKHLIVAPRYEMDYAIAVTAWNKLLSLEAVDEEKIQAFIRKYEGVDHHSR